VRVDLTVEDELCVHLICFPSSNLDENSIVLPDWIDKHFQVKCDQITIKAVDNSKGNIREPIPQLQFEKVNLLLINQHIHS